MNAFKRASIKHNGAWTPIVNLYIKHSGTWKRVDDGYIKHQGQWMLTHNPDAVVSLNYTIPYFSTSESYHYSNFNLLDWVSSHKDRNGIQWPRDSFKTYPFKITVTVELGVIIKGPFTIPADFDKATRVVLRNYGSIYGSAGKGGNALPPYAPSSSADYLKTFSSANGQDGTDSIINHSNLVLENFGSIYPGGGGGHGGIPNILYLSNGGVKFPYFWREMPGWWDNVSDLSGSVWVPFRVWYNENLLASYLAGYPGLIPYYSFCPTCDGRILARRTPISWAYSDDTGSSNIRVSHIIAEYGYNLPGRPLTAVSNPSITALHGGNGGGGAGVDSLPGNYPDILKPISNVGDESTASSWGEVQSIIATVATSMVNGATSNAEALAFLQSKQNSHNFSVDAVSLSAGTIHWALPLRHVSMYCFWYGWQPRYSVEDVPWHYGGVTFTTSIVVLTTNYYRKNWLDSQARLQSYSLGTAGTIFYGGQGGKTTYTKTTPNSSWFNAWNGQAGNGGGAGQNGQSLTIPASSYNGYSLPAVTISGGKGGASIRTYSNRGSFVLLSNSGTISGEPVYS